MVLTSSTQNYIIIMFKGKSIIKGRLLGIIHAEAV